MVPIPCGGARDRIRQYAASPLRLLRHHRHNRVHLSSFPCVAAIRHRLPAGVTPPVRRIHTTIATWAGHGRDSRAVRVRCNTLLNIELRPRLAARHPSFLRERRLRRELRRQLDRRPSGRQRPLVRSPSPSAPKRGGKITAHGVSHSVTTGYATSPGGATPDSILGTGAFVGQSSRLELEQASGLRSSEAWASNGVGWLQAIPARSLRGERRCRTPSRRLGPQLPIQIRSPYLRTFYCPQHVAFGYWGHYTIPR
jgi:hypothetical protein